MSGRRRPGSFINVNGRSPAPSTAATNTAATSTERRRLVACCKTLQAKPLRIAPPAVVRNGDRQGARTTRPKNTTTFFDLLAEDWKRGVWDSSPNFTPLPAERPTEAPPGSKQKQRVMAHRLNSGQNLFHEDDYADGKYLG